MEFVEDDEFLSQVAAAEAAALSSSTAASKRRRISTTVTPTSISTSAANSSNITSTAVQNSNNTTVNLREGAYIAALKGSKSLEFQQQAKIFSSSSVPRQNYNPYSTSYNSNSSFPTSDSGNTCFKCGKSGHWARDCDAGPINDEYGSANFPEKKCPCGLGICIILTANTDKNRGRKFYKCPSRQENGGCDFFEWCDKPSFTYNTAIQNNSATNFSIAELSCPCGAGPCRVLTAKTGNNIGQQFYRCPSQIDLGAKDLEDGLVMSPISSRILFLIPFERGYSGESRYADLDSNGRSDIDSEVDAKKQESCGFFKWCNEITNAAGSTESRKAPQFYQSTNNMSNKSHNSATCFKCGKEGHWAKDCVQSPTDGGGKLNSMCNKSHNSATCFKYGKEGHWAKDCTHSFSLSSPTNGGGKSTTVTTCFKCGMPGHWAKDCTSVVDKRA
nr:DNA-binding protein HEXBP-like [Ipomoea batatas]